MTTILNDVIEQNLRAIKDNRLLLECLELRLSLIRKDFANLSEYEKNEVDIQEIKTIIEVNKLKAIISQKVHDLNDNMRVYVQELQELEENGNV